MPDTASTSAGEETLEQQLEGCWRSRRSNRRRGFREHALLSDPSVYDEAEKDWTGWWVKQAKELHWLSTARAAASA